MESIKNLFSTFHHLKQEKTNDWLLMFLGMGLSLGVLMYICRNLYLKSLEVQTIYKIRLENNGKEVYFNALLDTGNDLYEPMSGKPVCIVESEIMSNLLSLNEENENLWISYQCLGTQNGKLAVHVIEQMMIIKDAKIWSHKKVLVGCYDGVLNKKRRYKGILHPELIKGIY